MKKRSTKPLPRVEKPSPRQRQTGGEGGKTLRLVSHVEEELRESEARFLSAFEYAAIGMALVGTDGRWLKVNHAVCELTGYPDHELLSMTFQDITHPDDLEKDLDYVRQMLAGTMRTYQMEKRYLHKRGHLIWVLLSVSLVRDTGGHPAYFISQIQNITQRKQVEEALRGSEERYRALVESSPDAISVQKEGRFLYANAAAFRLYGVASFEQLATIDVLNFSPTEDREATRARWKQALEGRPLSFRETWILRLDGVEVPVEVNARLVEFHGEHAVQAIVRDISERKQTERALDAERERLAVTLRSIGDAVITTDREGRVVFMNQIAEALTGWEQARAVGRPLGEVFHIINEKTGERCEDPVTKVLATGGIIGLANHTALIARDGMQRVIEDSGAPIRDRESRIIGVVLVFRDVTEKHRMREEMLRANRLDSLGILAGGIAHDFNNILTIIMGNTSLAMMTAPPADRLQKQLLETEKACLRAKDLTEQLLTFSKGGTPVRKTASLPDLVRESVDFALRGSAVKCHYEFATDLRAVEVDSAQVSRVFSNLALNGAQAMPSGGNFVVSACNLELGAGTILPLVPGCYVEISFRDHGIGILPEHLSRVFDPFFTTKQQGSGLGLSICYSVVSRHGGHISVESEMGKGSVFHVLLPATEQKPPEEKLAQTVSVAFRGRLLVMDDEDAVREVATEMLGALGCEVECAADGARAVELYRWAREGDRPFDAVLMDLTVPGGMGGREAARELLALDPKAKIVASSGYSTDPVMADPLRHGFRTTIAKPYTVKELARILTSVLET